MDEHAETRLLEPCACGREQAQVLERAARELDRARLVDLQRRSNGDPTLERHRTSRLLDIRRRRAPWFANRRLPAGERDRLEMRDAVELAQVATQELAAPERAVGPVAGAVEHDRE